MNLALNNDSFYLIWLYWFKKYIQPIKNIPPQEQHSALESKLKKQYLIEAVDSIIIEQKTQLIRQQTKYIPNSVFVIDPEQEIKNIEAVILRAYQQQIIEEEKKNQLINQLYSYYLNSKNIFIIYKREFSSESSESIPLQSLKGSDRIDQTDNISEGNHRVLSTANILSRLRDNRTQNNFRLRLSNLSNLSESQIMNKLKYSHNEDDFLEARNQSLIDPLEYLETKIEDLELIDLLAQFEGVQVWNAKYRHIHHTFIKTKKVQWTKCLSLPILHPCHPKKINQFPILPKITKFKPSPEKLLPFASYLKKLQKKIPCYSPCIESIFEYNNMPYVLTQQEMAGSLPSLSKWNQQSHVMVLCFYIVFGDSEGKITTRKVERWMEQNQDEQLTKVIKDLLKIQKDKVKGKKDESKPFIFLTGDQDSEQIW